MPTDKPGFIEAAGCRIARVPVSGRVAAARRLLGQAGGDAASARRMIESAKGYGIDLHNMWASYSKAGERPGQVCLAVAGSGRSAMLFVSSPRSKAEEVELSAVVERACEGLDGVCLAQALLEPHERSAERALLASGFRCVGTLSYMQRDMPRPGELAPVADWPTGVVVRRYQPGDDAGLVAGLDLTYEGTLDCPELCGLRTTTDVLASHRAAGRWEPSLWWVVEREGRIEGMALYNPSPEMDCVELVYIGLSPPLRGHGLGRCLLEHTLASLAGRSERRVSCAVDERNTPARRAYGRVGFTEAARRVALVRPLAPVA